MTAQTAEYMETIAHLTPGARIRVDSVTWSDYEQLLVDLGDDHKARVSYDRGSMEIVAPLPIHEKPDPRSCDYPGR